MLVVSWEVISLLCNSRSQTKRVHFCCLTFISGKCTFSVALLSGKILRCIKHSGPFLSSSGVLQVFKWLIICKEGEDVRRTRGKSMMPPQHGLQIVKFDLTWPIFRFFSLVLMHLSLYSFATLSISSYPMLPRKFHVSETEICDHSTQAERLLHLNFPS